MQPGDEFKTSMQEQLYVRRKSTPTEMRPWGDAQYQYRTAERQEIDAVSGSAGVLRRGVSALAVLKSRPERSIVRLLARQVGVRVQRFEVWQRTGIPDAYMRMRVLNLIGQLEAEIRSLTETYE